ncbi:MAG: radical SAM protein [Candidatus Bathyarchaeota archaeon]|nr:radical SAM protein [Candidatus Bathyarchaeota archaeon]
MRLILTPDGFFAYDKESGLCLFTPDVKSKIWLKPLYAQVAVTERCNLQCWWCYASSSPDREKELSAEELKKLISFFDSWGLLGVAFGGGEPFLHPI